MTAVLSDSLTNHYHILSSKLLTYCEHIGLTAQVINFYWYEIYIFIRSVQLYIFAVLGYMIHYQIIFNQ